MNRKEYELIARVFREHRASYGNRTDTVALEILADMVGMLQENYTNFHPMRFYEEVNLTLAEVEHIERIYNN